MSVKVERKENNLVELEVTVEREEFEKYVDMAFRKNAHKVNIPGFRHGKAPRKVIEKMYGSGVFYEDAVDMSFPEAYQNAIEEHNIDPVERPEVDVTSISEDGYTFTAKVHVIPEVTLGEYKGLSAEKKSAECSDDDINAELERLMTRNARVETSERPLENGDTAVIDFEGFVDDVAFEGGKGENYSLVIGSGQFIPGFEEQLTGKSAGDSCDVNVNFPEQYHAEDLAGKAAVFKVTVNETKMTIKPELDDEFAKDVSEFDTLDELKTDIRDKIIKNREVEADELFETAIVDKLLENLVCDVPEVMIEERISTIMQDFSYRLSMQRLELTQYLQLTGQTFEDLQNQHRETAQKHVKCELAFRKIAELEGFTVTKEELDEEYARLAASYNMPEDKVREAISIKSLTRDLLGMKGSKFLTDSAVAISN